MRTTIDLDDDLLKRLRDAAHREGVPFRALLHRVIYRGLEDGRHDPEPPYRVPAVSLGREAAGVNLVKALALAAALEDEEVIAKLERHR